MFTGRLRSGADQLLMRASPQVPTLAEFYSHPDEHYRREIGKCSNGWCAALLGYCRPWGYGWEWRR